MARDGRTAEGKWSQQGDRVSYQWSDPATKALQQRTLRIVAADAKWVMVEVEWDTSQGGRFTVVLQVSAIDRAGLLRDISDTLTDCGVMILSSSSWAKRDGTARLRFAFELADVGHLDHIQKTVRRVEGVFDSYRVLPLKSREG